MKKLINSVETVEDEMIQGLVKAYPQYLKKIDGHNVVVRAKKKEGKVALISGGGSFKRLVWMPITMKKLALQLVI